MRFEGVLKSWNDDRGFGFIEPSHGTDEVFVHIKAFSGRRQRPAVGQWVSFEIEAGPQGRKRAKNVETARAAPAASARREERPAEWGIASALAIPLFAAIYVVASLQWRVSLLWAAAYLLVSIVTLFAYTFDKSAAVRGGWRTKESTLLGLGLLCGWPGALIAQQRLRHKSSKRAFRAAFWVTVVMNVAAFLVLNSPYAPRLLLR